MKSTSAVVPLLLSTTAHFPSITSCFEIHTEELLSHSILARLILESPSRRAIATRQKGAMAFLAEKAVVEPAFLTEREFSNDNGKQSSSDVVAEAVVEEREAEKKSKQAPLAFGLAPP